MFRKKQYIFLLYERFLFRECFKNSLKKIFSGNYFEIILNLQKLGNNIIGIRTNMNRK